MLGLALVVAGVVLGVQLGRGPADRWADDPAGPAFDRMTDTERVRWLAGRWEGPGGFEWTELDLHWSVEFTMVRYHNGQENERSSGRWNFENGTLVVEVQRTTDPGTPARRFRSEVRDASADRSTLYTREVGKEIPFTRRR